MVTTPNEDTPAPPDVERSEATELAPDMRLVLSVPEGERCGLCTLPLIAGQAVVTAEGRVFHHSYCWDNR